MRCSKSSLPLTLCPSMIQWEFGQGLLTLIFCPLQHTGPNISLKKTWKLYYKSEIILYCLQVQKVWISIALHLVHGSLQGLELDICVCLIWATTMLRCWGTPIAMVPPYSSEWGTADPVVMGRGCPLFIRKKAACTSLPWTVPRSFKMYQLKNHVLLRERIELSRFQTYGQFEINCNRITVK